MPLIHPIRVYWEDTDAAGIVYYANYLKFAERARTETLRQIGVEQQAFREQTGLAFVVRRCEIDYHAPARLDDLLTVQTELQEIGKVRMTMQQRIYRDEALLAKLTVKLGCVDRQGRPAPWPEPLTEKMRELFGNFGEQHDN